tara:strand:+ start:235 stop:624 length:390 start_codon:yes stop_codon:yes gene_type:complete
MISRKERGRRYRENNAEYIKSYRTSYTGKYNRNKGHWKNSGIVEPEEGWKVFYDTKFYPATNCDICNKTFDNDITITKNKSNKKCLDHHHSSGHIRNIVCMPCNNKVGKTDGLLRYVLLDIHRYHHIKN